MNKIYKKLRTTKWLWVVMAGLLLVVGLVATHHHAKDTPYLAPAKTTLVGTNNKIDYSPATKADNAPNEDRKNSSSPISATLGSNSPPANTGSFSVAVSRAGLDDSGQNLQVAALVSGVTSGICIVRATQSGQSDVTMSDNVILQVNNYVCPVVNIPVAQFPNRGSWSVSVTVTSDGKSVTADWSANPVSLGN